MSGGSLQLREYPAETVRLSCQKCGRAGQYRKQNLIAATEVIFGCRICARRFPSASVTVRCMTPAWFDMLI
jgi:hypothetical protein